jgi:pimeloyl-ACP methyl ester carboxylesterase
VLLGAVAACSRHGPADAVPATAAAGGDEGPRIAMSPDNVHIEYRVYGHGDPAVVLVHGWASDANYWNAQLGALESRYTVVALNLAGHGASGNNRNDWSIANYAQDVAAVARQIPNPRLVLVGHSMGAAVSR